MNNVIIWNGSIIEPSPFLGSPGLHYDTIKIYLGADPFYLNIAGKMKVKLIFFKKRI